MKKLFKRKISFFLAMIMCFSCVASASAVEVQDSSEESDSFTITVIPNEEADQYLPEELLEAIVEAETAEDSSDVSVCGTSIPKKSKKWNLTSDERYDFSVSTTYHTIYSDYVFTGHSGKVKIHLHETGDNGGEYIFYLYKRDGNKTVVMSKTIDQGTTKDYTVDGIGSDDLVYFAIVPTDNVHTILKSSYIKKG
ncbi:MAG: hypothetical protein LUD84_09990 [Clostridiales bacterium]|nr:hypothetical protein [Clostridiales bacterium]